MEQEANVEPAEHVTRMEVVMQGAQRVKGWLHGHGRTDMDGLRGHDRLGMDGPCGRDMEHKKLVDLICM